jgi:hypothetical protein
MSTLTIKSPFSMHGTSGSKRDARKKVASAMQPRRGRTIALTVGAVAVTLFSVLAPLAYNPSDRLFALEATSTIPVDETLSAERLFDLGPTTMGPAITSEVLMRLDEEALHLPALEVRATPPEDEVVRGVPQG